MSSSVKVIALVVSKKARLAYDSAMKHSILKSAAILMRDSVVTLLASGPNLSWLNSDLNLGFFWRILQILPLLLGSHGLLQLPSLSFSGWARGSFALLAPSK